ncbi:MAG: FeoA family protein [Treponema sp.]
MIPLIMIQAGEKATVLRFDGDGAEFSRVRSFGLDVNTELAVITSQADVSGPLLLQVNGSKYAIDYDLAARIMVMPIAG